MTRAALMLLQRLDWRGAHLKDENTVDEVHNVLVVERNLRPVNVEDADHRCAGLEQIDRHMVPSAVIGGYQLLVSKFRTPKLSLFESLENISKIQNYTLL